MDQKMSSAMQNETCLENVLDIVCVRMFGRYDGGDDEKRTLLRSYAQEVCKRVRHYCNIDALPDELEETLAAMTSDLIKVEGVELDGQGWNGTIESIKLGDAQFGWGGVSSISQNTVDGILRNYSTDLHRFRRMAI